MLTLLIGASLLSGGDDPVASTSGARSSPWSALDARIARAGPALGGDGDGEEGGHWGFLLRPFYTLSDLAADAPGANEDVSGFLIEDADLWFELELDRAEMRVSVDLEGGDVELEDAFAAWEEREWLVLKAGQFKPRVMRSNAVSDGHLLFRDRTFLGAAFDARDDGVEVSGHYDQFDWFLAVTDGSTGSRSDHFWSARGEWALYDAAWDDVEGARGAPDHLRVLMGATLFADNGQSTDRGDGIGFDLAITFGPYAFHGEWADLDRDFARSIDVFNGAVVTLGDGSPGSLTFSRRLGEGLEGALRFQSADDANDTTQWGVAASWLPDAVGARFVAEVSGVETDTDDFTLFSVGLAVGSDGLRRPFLGR